MFCGKESNAGHLGSWPSPGTSCLRDGGKGPSSLWASGPSCVNGDNSSFFVVLLGSSVEWGPEELSTLWMPSNWQLLVVIMERLWNQGMGKSPRPTAASLPEGPQPALWLPPAAPGQPLCCVLARLQGCLCLSVGFLVRPGIWSARLTPAEYFQLGLGNWCQLLWGEWLALPVLLAGRLQSVAGPWPETQAFPQGPCGVTWKQSRWKLVFTCLMDKGPNHSRLHPWVLVHRHCCQCLLLGKEII